MALLELLVAGPMNACAMVSRCLRHQMSDLFGGADVPEPHIPPELRYGRGDAYEPGVVLAEESQGHPEAVRLD